MSPAGKRIDVLYLIPNLGLGGAEMSLYTLLKYIDRSRVRPRVVMFYDEEDSRIGHRTNHFLPLIEAMGIPVTSLRAHRVRDVPKAIWRLYQNVRRNRPDLIHTQLFVANIAGRVAGRVARLPVVSTIQSLDYEPERLVTYTNPNRLRVLAMLSADRFTARFCCDMVIPISHGVAASTRRWLKVRPDHMTVIYNPVDTRYFHGSDERARRTMRQALGVGEDARLILNVGRIMYAKGQIDLVQAMPEILASVPDAHLVVLGDVADKVCNAELVAAIERLGIGAHCHFPGASDQVRDWLEACDVFAFPSIFEGMGIAMAEAMLCRRAVVASSIVTLAEQIQDDVTGLLVPPQDSHSLATAIVRLLQDPALASRLGEAARRQAVQSYDPVRYSERMLDIYDHVLSAS